MATLHIEHPITDLDTWLSAFRNFEDARQKAGVQGHRVWQPVGEDAYVVIALDFATAEQADNFKRFLETNVWNSPEASPALVGTPRARVLDEVDTSGA